MGHLVYGLHVPSLVIGIRAGNGQTYLDMIGQSIDMDKEVKPNPNSSYKHSRKGKRACRELLPSLFKYKTARLMTH